MGYHHHYKPRDFDFAQQLLTLRKRTGLTQEVVALQIGVSEKAIRNWEGGCHYPSERNLRKLIELYLGKNVFASEHEQKEARLLWDQLRESTSRHISSFDEQWFATLLQEWRVHHPSRFLRGDWSEAPDVSFWFGRTDELAELERWLLADQCRLVAVLGMGGIGKTALAVKLAQQVAYSFDCVMWRSLRNAPPLEDLLRDWLPIVAQQPNIPPPHSVDQGLTLLIKLLQERRCLLVLDNLETLFQEGLLGGRYRQGYEEYATLIRHVAGSTHRSCLLLTCRELLPDLEIFTGRQTPVRVFRLGSLTLSASQQLLQEKGIFGDLATWSELVQRYGGNPLALKIVAETIHELFGGDITAFLAEGFTTFHGIRQLLTQQFERLSALEQELVYWLAIERELIALDGLREDLERPVNKSRVIEAMYSLHSRSLVERGEHGAVFTLQPVVLEYVTERLVALVSEEICENRPTLLLQHALLKGQAKDYIRTSQSRLILQPVLDQLLSRFGSIQRLEAQLELLLQQLRALPRAEQGYGGGNIVNLFVRLNGHVKGKDCSHLTIWQANLQGAEAQETTFVESDLTGSVFTETMDGIMSVAFSANGQYVAGGCNNGEIRLWRATDGKPLLALSGHNRVVWSLACNPESTLLASGGYDGLVKVWEANSGQCVSTLQGHTKWVRSVAFHPAGRLLATGSDDGSIRVWDLSSGCCLKIWYERPSEVRSVAFSPDGQRLASGYADGIVKVWDLASEQCLWSIAAHHGSAASSLAFSPNGELLVSGGEDATIMVWQAASGEHLSILSGHTDPVLSVAFNAEGLLASGSFDGTVKLWQVGHRGKASRCLSTLQGHTGWVWSVAFGPDGLLASGSHDGVVKLWEISRGGEGGKCLRTLRGHSRVIHSVGLSPDGKILVSGGHNGNLRMWNTRSGQCVSIASRQTGGLFAVAFSRDGQFFANSTPYKVIGIWEADSGQYLRSLKGHQGEVWSVAFSPDGRFLVSGSADMTTKLWEVDSGHCLATFQEHNSWIWSVAYSPDRTLLASGDVDGVVKLWEISSGQCLRTLQGSSNAIVALTFTPDSTRLLSSNAQDLVTVWGVKSGHCLMTLPGTGETYWARSVAFSDDGSLLAAASSDQTIKVWDVSSGKVHSTFPCGAGRPWTVAFSADQRLLATGTDEGTILLWEWQTGTCLMTLQSEGPYERMNITGVTGLTEAQKASLKTLGAIDEEESRSLENLSRHMYQPAELMTPVQVYRTLGIARQSLYDRLHKGKLTPIHLHGNLQFLRSEIEAWKMQREQKRRVEKHEG